MALLEIENLRVAYRSGGREALAVDGVSLTLEKGEYLGLVGESGCGKSTIAKAILGILPQGARVAGGSVRYQERELIGLSLAELRRIRWRDIALVPQSAMNGFDPVYTIAYQLDEVIAAHRQLPRVTRRQRVAELFELVGLPHERADDYPHQFSGGMRQRAMIAMAMVLDPKLIIADEPTTGLDVIVQDQILERMRVIHNRIGNAMLLITHDMALVSENCDKIAVMYSGHIMEYGGDDVLKTPFHPYTMALCSAFPNLTEQDRELISIPGTPPSLFERVLGCPFHERCPFATAICAKETPALMEVSPGHVVACHHSSMAENFRMRAREPATWRGS